MYVLRRRRINMEQNLPLAVGLLITMQNGHTCYSIMKQRKRGKERERIRKHKKS